MTARWAFVKSVIGIPKICPLCDSHLSEEELKEEKCSKCNCQWIVKESGSEVKR
ncbi:MAG: hypothetical protein ACFE8A_13340 [Candidatus Hodarchaeota archaeon]